MDSLSSAVSGERHKSPAAKEGHGGQTQPSTYTEPWQTRLAKPKATWLAPVGSHHPKSADISLAFVNAGRSAALDPVVDFMRTAPHRPAARTSTGHTVSLTTPRRCNMGGATVPQSRGRGRGERASDIAGLGRPPPALRGPIGLSTDITKLWE